MSPKGSHDWAFQKFQQGYLPITITLGESIFLFGSLLDLRTKFRTKFLRSGRYLCMDSFNMHSNLHKNWIMRGLRLLWPNIQVKAFGNQQQHFPMLLWCSSLAWYIDSCLCHHRCWLAFWVFPAFPGFISGLICYSINSFILSALAMFVLIYFDNFFLRLCLFLLSPSEPLSLLSFLTFISDLFLNLFLFFPSIFLK